MNRLLTAKVGPKFVPVKTPSNSTQSLGITKADGVAGVISDSVGEDAAATDGDDGDSDVDCELTLIVGGVADFTTSDFASESASPLIAFFHLETKPFASSATFESENLRKLPHTTPTDVFCATRCIDG